MLNEQHFYLLGQIQNSQTGGRPYNDTSPYGEYSLERGIEQSTPRKRIENKPILSLYVL